MAKTFELLNLGLEQSLIIVNIEDMLVDALDRLDSQHLKRREAYDVGRSAVWRLLLRASDTMTAHYSDLLDFCTAKDMSDGLTWADCKPSPTQCFALAIIYGLFYTDPNFTGVNATFALRWTKELDNPNLREVVARKGGQVITEDGTHYAVNPEDSWPSDGSVLVTFNKALVKNERVFDMRYAWSYADTATITPDIELLKSSACHVIGVRAPVKEEPEAPAQVQTQEEKHEDSEADSDAFVDPLKELVENGYTLRDRQLKSHPVFSKNWVLDIVRYSGDEYTWVYETVPAKFVDWETTETHGIVAYRRSKVTRASLINEARVSLEDALKKLRTAMHVTSNHEKFDAVRVAIRELNSVIGSVNDL